MMDLAAIAAGVGIAKSGFEALRTALRLVKDVQGALPPGEKKETVERALAEADNQLHLARPRWRRHSAILFADANSHPPLCLQWVTGSMRVCMNIVSSHTRRKGLSSHRVV